MTGTGSTYDAARFTTAISSSAQAWHSMATAVSRAGSRAYSPLHLPPPPLDAREDAHEIRNV